MKKVVVKILRGDKQKIEKELVLKVRKLYVLKNEKLRAEIIQLYYNLLVARYRERWKITELVMRNYRIEVPAEKLMMNEILEKLQIYLMVVKLSLVAEKDMILVVYDRLSKIEHLVVITRNISKEIGKIVQE